MSGKAQNLDLKIRNAKPKDREFTIACGSGLVLRVLPHGAKTFSLRYRPKGSTAQRRVTIGNYPNTTLTKARSEVEIIRSAVRDGEDPVVEAERRQREADAPATVTQLAERFIRDYVKLRNRPSTAAETERILRTYVLPSLGKRRLPDVHRSDISALLQGELSRILAEAKGQAKRAGGNTGQRQRGSSVNRIKAATSKMFAFAVSSGWLEHNPAAGIQALLPEKPRARALNERELGQLWQRLNRPLDAGETRATTHRVIAVLLLTGARASEIATLRRRHIDLAGGTITLEDTKTDESDRTVALAPAAISVLREAMDETGSTRPGAYIFPASPEMQRKALAGGGIRAPHVHRESVTRAGARIADDLGHTVPVPWTIHDLRRTFISWAHENGYEPDLVRKATGHKPSDVHGRVYDRSTRVELMRGMMTAWADHIEACADRAGANADFLR